MENRSDRRPIATRSATWAQSLASLLVRWQVTPNQVSVASVFFALLGAGFYIVTTLESAPLWRSLCFIGAACCIQLRLICNLLDGMIAIEGGRATKVGALFNEFPDRLADSLFLVAAGYTAGSGSLAVELGWAAALCAALTAYIRVFGAAQNLPQDFCGPMAKQHRMAILTVASLLAAGEAAYHYPPRIMVFALGLIAVGAAVTCVKRTRRLAKALSARTE